MHHRLKSLSLATATLLLSLFTPLLPLTLKFEPLVVQAQTVQDRNAEAMRLYEEGRQQFNRGQFREALEKFQQALVIVREIIDLHDEITILLAIGDLYADSLYQFPQALEFYQQALVASRKIGTPNRQEVLSLKKIGEMHYFLSSYAKALEFLQQGLTVSTKIGDRRLQAVHLFRLAGIYSVLGQYRQALDLDQQALAITREISDRRGEGLTLRSIGKDYLALGEYSEALQFFQQALAISRELSNRIDEGSIYGFIASTALKLGKYSQALGSAQQALTIAREVGDSWWEAYALDNLAKTYSSLEENEQALELYQQSLALHRNMNNRSGEAGVLSRLGDVFKKQNKSELAIVFYKQSVNVTEAIRKDLRVLPKEQQQSFTETVAGTYRRLADLLLKQDRVLEAQRVLDLLKIQELDDYLRNVRGNQQTQQGVDYLPPEQQLLTQYNAKLTQVIQLGKELDTLQKIPPSDRTPQQEQRRREIEAEQQKLTRDYLDFIRSPQIVALVGQLSRTTGGENLNPQLLRSLQDNLKKLAQDAVLLYPLILDDRLELVLVTPYAPPIRRPVPIKREELNRTIAEFRSALTHPNSNAKEPAQKLYNWLIKPIEPALKEANAKTIIYAPDGQLRYIPLAALYDGNKWLVQKYRINNITALSLTEWDKKPQNLKVLAGAFTQGNYSFQVGGKTFNFGGLPSAGKEVENLASTVPGTTKLLDRNFSQKDTVARMSDYSIIHFATHASFVTGQPEDSFILFGNGDRANFHDVETWPLTNTDLVVLSACETGVGGKLGDGTEIFGFGYLMQQAGARAAIASLWTVDDGGTQALMDAFYAALESKQVGQDSQPTKAEALRQAQIALITGDYKALGQQRGLGVQQRIQRSLSPKVATRLSHPYYWAPFILIGNGL